jgi:hypothetical protein
VSAHQPIRPGWLCSGCGAEWPCRTRRMQLLAEYEHAPVSLALYAGATFVDAAQDLAGAPAGSLYHRFVAWVRPSAAGR